MDDRIIDENSLIWFSKVYKNVKRKKNETTYLGLMLYHVDDFYVLRLLG